MLFIINKYYFNNFFKDNFFKDNIFINIICYLNNLNFNITLFYL